MRPDPLSGPAESPESRLREADVRWHPGHRFHGLAAARNAAAPFTIPLSSRRNQGVDPRLLSSIGLLEAGDRLARIADASTPLLLFA